VIAINKMLKQTFLAALYDTVIQLFAPPPALHTLSFLAIPLTFSVMYFNKTTAVLHFSNRHISPEVSIQHFITCLAAPQNIFLFWGRMSLTGAVLPAGKPAY